MPGYIQQLRNLTLEQRDREIDNKICETYHKIKDDSIFIDTYTDTNVTGWSIEAFLVTDHVADLDLSGHVVVINGTYEASGEQAEDMGLPGTRITGDAVARIDDDGEVTYSVETAEIDLGEDV